MKLKTGDIIDGKYCIVRLLGKGGMGNVYLGENVRIRRRVAIKVLNAEAAQDEDNVRRFQREAQAAGRIGSDHICEVLDLGELPSGHHYMVMEYLEGEALHDLITREDKVSADVLFPIIVELLQGLYEAHSAGIIHRDLKPHNVFLLSERDGRKNFVKILDFGVSKFRPDEGGEKMQATRTGALLGTPYYMSPEQARCEKNIDHRADLFAVGVILFRGFTGRFPFETELFHELIMMLALEQAPAINTIIENLNPDAAAIVDKALAAAPADRYQDALEMAADMRNWLNKHSLVPPPMTSGVRRWMADHGTDKASSQTQDAPPAAKPEPGNVEPSASTDNEPSAQRPATPASGNISIAVDLDDDPEKSGGFDATVGGEVLATSVATEEPAAAAGATPLAMTNTLAAVPMKGNAGRWLLLAAGVAGLAVAGTLIVSRHNDDPAAATHTTTQTSATPNATASAANTAAPRATTPSPSTSVPMAAATPPPTTSAAAAKRPTASKTPKTGGKAPTAPPAATKTTAPQPPPTTKTSGRRIRRVLED